MRIAVKLVGTVGRHLARSNIVATRKLMQSESTMSLFDLL